LPRAILTDRNTPGLVSRTGLTGGPTLSDLFSDATLSAAAPKPKSDIGNAISLLGVEGVLAADISIRRLLMVLMALSRFRLVVSSAMLLLAKCVFWLTVLRASRFVELFGHDSLRVCAAMIRVYASCALVTVLLGWCATRVVLSAISNIIRVVSEMMRWFTKGTREPSMMLTAASTGNMARVR